MKNAAEISPVHMENDDASPFVLDASVPFVALAPQIKPSARYEVYLGDAVEWLRTLPNACADLVITDPPYESLEKHRAIGTTTRLKRSKSSSNDWFSIFPNGRFEELFAEIWRILKRNTHFYLFCDAETMFVAKPIAEKVGFKFWKPIVWDKKKIGMGYHYRSRYEFILFFEKGKRKLSNLGTPDVLEFPRIINGYPTEKPVELSRILIEQSSIMGERVVDPFMGTASVGTAAVSLGRTFWGNDISEKALELARIRLQAVAEGNTCTVQRGESQSRLIKGATKEPSGPRDGRRTPRRRAQPA